MPNLIVMFVLFISLFSTHIIGITYGVFLGIFIDLIIGKRIGISGIMLGIVGLAGGILDKNFSKESKLTIIIMVIVSTLIYEIGSYLFGYFMYNFDLEVLSFTKMLFIEILYNVILTIIFYPLIKSLGYKIIAKAKLKSVSRQIVIK